MLPAAYADNVLRLLVLWLQNALQEAQETRLKQEQALRELNDLKTLVRHCLLLWPSTVIAMALSKPDTACMTAASGKQTAASVIWSSQKCHAMLCR